MRARCQADFHYRPVQISGTGSNTLYKMFKSKVCAFDGAHESPLHPESRRSGSASAFIWTSDPPTWRRLATLGKPLQTVLFFGERLNLAITSHSDGKRQDRLAAFIMEPLGKFRPD